ncbi:MULTISPECIES: DNA polymerase/3'-5' exonuclease PolX [unclassified Halanaerobium]|uniref:DNA polymerase/3'-5' exonuclease PolX n=1 Tax=unclassified Halanaerobium TaxID=2641197 RepID=UPI000DF31B48|nr:MULTISPECIES: DNA polymerase/3'-5' exonuclease PolX [unclassified Halanaerobium]RCW50491.1 DNA polymerase (family 10) [Halanaerobium sp. MA284_MarDTE_T2]RCW85978.1 DNA polymerase (family 10) [Halanaerobium sp. DL-01]
MEKLTNKEVSKLLAEFGDLLAINGENEFKIRAYNNAARKIQSLEANLSELIKEDSLEDIKGIGKGIAGTIKEIFENGFSQEMEELKRELPSGVLEMTKIPNLGPKRAHQLYYELGLKSVAELREALENNKVRELKGFGPKSEQKLLKGLQNYKKYVDRIIISQAVEEADKLINALKNSVEEGIIKNIEVCGSTRRRKEMIGDIDILVACAAEDKESLSKKITELELTDEIIGAGDKKVSIITCDGLQVDFRLVSSEEFPSALHYFTGSQAHNVRMRQLAKDHNLKLNEYGLIKNDDSRIDIKSEEDIFVHLGLKYIIPELREDSGEIEAAAEDRLPVSIEVSDIKGDLHMHSRYSDGAFTIEEMGEAARKRGYSYIAITDHSKSLKVANGMSVERLKKQLQEIDEVNKKMDGFRILKGIEVDIMPDGSLDFEDEILSELDLVIASVHSSFAMTEEEMTARIIKAVKNTEVNILAHPRGRILGGRAAYKVDMNQVIEAALESNTALEINSSPHRLDLDDKWSRRAKEAGALLTINTDAHHYREFNDIKYGVSVARRGWLEKDDVINTFDLDKLMKFLRED